MNLIQKFVSSILSRKIVNRYVLVSVLFVIWIVFLDKYNYFTQKSLSNNLHEIQQAISTKSEEIKLARIEHDHLKQNKEKIAREKYLLHQKNEEVFIIDKK